MKKQPIERFSIAEINRLRDDTDWERVDALTDEEIEAAAKEDADAEMLPADWVDRAELAMSTEGKERVTIRLDRGIVEYFKSQGGGYQSRINAVLRAYVFEKRQASIRRARRRAGSPKERTHR